MTTIAVDKKAVCADSIGIINDDYRVETKIKKLYLRDGLIYGCAGNADAIEDLIAWFAGDQDPAKYPKPLGSKWIFLVFFADRAIAFDEDSHRHVERPYPASFGSGRDYAMGALRAGADSYKAVKIACDLSIHSGGKIMRVLLPKITYKQWLKGRAK